MGMLGQSVSGIMAIGVTGMVVLDGIIAMAVWSLYPSNHWAYDVRWAYLGCAAMLAVSVVGAFWLRARKWVSIIGICLSVGSAVGIFILDRLNMLVQYDAWLKRGMPPFGG